MTLALAGLAVLTLSVVGPRPATVAAQTVSAAQVAAVDKLFEDPDRDESPGCTLEVRNDGQPVIGRSFGLANLEWRMPVRRFTLFEVGSVAKQFTAAAVAVLATQGKLSLDDEVHRYLPELPDYGTPVTLRQMLTHTSGLREWSELEAAAERPRGLHVHAQADVLRAMSQAKTLLFRPGTQFLYTHANYDLLAIVVERVSGMSFADFTTKALFEPLNMSDTQWRTDFTAVVEQRAEAYRKDGADWRRDMPFENVVGAGGLISSVPDLMLWNEELAAPKPENARWVAMIQQPGRLTDGRAIDYGLGLFVLSADGRAIVAHSGATAGYRAFLGRIPSQKISAALVCNGANFDTATLGMKVLHAFLNPPPREPTPALPSDAPQGR